MQRARPPILSHRIGDAVEHDPRGVDRRGRGPAQGQQQCEQGGEQRQLVEGQRLRRFRRGHSAHARGDRPVKDGVRQREQRADLERARSRLGDDEHAAKAHEQRQPARQAYRFLEQQRRGQGRKQRRGEVDGGGAGERHQAERDQQEHLRAALRNRAQHVMAKASRAEHG